MRAIVPLLLCLVLAGSAWATNANDRAGDERVVFSAAVLSLARPCDAPGADILHYSAELVGDEIVLGMGVASADPRIRCLGAHVGSAPLFVPQLALVSSDGTAPSLYLTIANASSCAHVEVPGVGPATLCGEHGRDGKEVTWRFDAQPVVTTKDGPLTLDLRDTIFRYSARVVVHGAMDPLGEVRYVAHDETGAILFRTVAP